MNEVQTTDHNPLRAAGAVTAPQQGGGALVAVEQQRAIAEVQARMLIARTNPRDPIRCMDLILNDCERPTVAESAVYQYARGGSDISGPSIKLAEGIARRWGNIASGIKEMSRANGYSECIAYAWDLESGFYDERQFQVRHWRDTKGGGYPLKDERDIYELIANNGQRRKRAVLLAVIPDDVVDAAVKACERTMKTRADTSEEAMARMVDAFAEFKVTRAQIEARIQRRLDAITPANVVSLKKIYSSLRDGMSSASDWFDPDPAAAQGSAQASASGEAPQSATQRAREALKRRAGGKGAPEPETAAAAPTAAPAEAPAAAPAAAPEQDAGPSAETLRDQLMAAADKDAAMLVIDRARHLPKTDYESLTALMDQRFPDA